jgi:hypothetical protein
MKLFDRHVALPGDHGTWAFFLGPLIVGLFVGGHWHTTVIYLIVAAACGFLVRQPVGLLVKIAAGRRGRDVLPAAVLWVLVYGGVAAVHVVGLVFRGFAYIMVLAVPGMLVFCWYLLLLYRRAERHQWVMEILATGSIALVAPACMWAGHGSAEPLGWWLWLLMWLQSATGIVYVYMRLEQRPLKRKPPAAERMRMGFPALTIAGTGVLVTAILAKFGVVSHWLWVPYLWQASEVLYGVLRPAMGARPTAIGVRQMLVMIVFVVLLIVLW